MCHAEIYQLRQPFPSREDIRKLMALRPEHRAAALILWGLAGKLREAAQ